ncbi:MAG: molybdate ABC transporter substrate-binding protein [Cyanobacteria bacterium J06632_22]
MALTLALTVMACGQAKTRLTVAGAASLEEALTEIEALYEADYPEIDVVYSWGGSGTLQQQISRGAPVDVLIAAGQQPVERLADQNRVLERRVLLTNRLVAIAPLSSSLQRLDDLSQAHRIAIGQVQTVPAGQYAEEALRSLNLLEAVTDNLVYASSVRGVLALVAQGHVDLGIVYATDAALSDRVRIIAEIPAAAHRPIRYESAILSSTAVLPGARSYLDFLQQPTAQSILERYGFVLP